MPIPILMPALSPTMEDGKLAKWHVKEGDQVAAGDLIAEIETDKATMEVEAVEEGTVGQLLVAEGAENVAVNAAIAVLLEEGEDRSALEEFAMGPGQTSAPTGAVVSEAAETTSAPANESAATMAFAGNGRIIASPLARRLAAQSNIDLAGIKGSGPNGRIVKRDIAGLSGEVPVTTPTALVSGQTASAPAVSAPAAFSDQQVLALYEPGSFDIIPHDNMRKVIAERLTVAKTTIPHFYLSIDCELDELLGARRRMNDTAPAEGHGSYKLSVNDFIIKAMALALQRVPDANATWTDQGLLRHKRSDVAVAVAVDGGLFTPVVRHADLKTLSEISNEMKDLALRARTKKLAPHEYQGGTTSISNLGMYGIRRFDAVINPPHASILAVGRGEKRPIVKGGKIEVATLMSVTLSCDHRVIDGALGAELLAAFQGFVEEPVTMLV